MPPTAAVEVDILGMEEPIKIDPGDEFAFSSLRIRTMQDDLKKHVPQANLPTAPIPPPKSQTLPPKPPAVPQKPPVLTTPKPQTPFPVPVAKPPAPKEVITEAPEQASVPKIGQFQKIISRVIPEPPPYLPSEPVLPPQLPPQPPPQPAQQTVKPAPAPIVPPPEKPEPIEPSPLSVLKLQSDLIYKEPPKPIQPPGQSRNTKLGLMFGGMAAVVILGIFGFIYYRLWLAPPKFCAEGQITEECRCGEQSEEVKTTGFCCDNLWANFDCALTRAPQPLIPSINELITIDAEGSSPDEVITDIKNSGANISDEDAKIIALKLADSPPRYATLTDLINIFGIVLPEDVRTNNQTYNLIAYFEPLENSSSTQTAISTPKTRLVLVLDQGDKTSLGQTMSAWETTMLADLRSVIVGEPTELATPEFVSTVYHNGLFRYRNLPTNKTTINYTVSENLIILGTSKNSIFYVYDSLISNNASNAD